MEKSGNSVELVFVVQLKAGLPKIEIKDLGTSARDNLDSALEAARARGSRRIADILNGAEMLSADAFAAEIGASARSPWTTTSAKRHGDRRSRRSRSAVSAFQDGSCLNRVNCFPVCRSFFEALGGRPWAVYRFLLTKHAELGGKRHAWPSRHAKRPRFGSRRGRQFNRHWYVRLMPHQRPPRGFKTRPLVTSQIASGDVWWRLYRRSHTDPLGFSYGPSRFSDPRTDLIPPKRYGVVYFGSTVKVCFAEAILRDRGVGRLQAPP